MNNEIENMKKILNEVKELLVKQNYDMARKMEHLEVEYYSLIQLLSTKGYINQKDYETWLSEKALQEVLDAVNDKLGGTDE